MLELLRVPGVGPRTVRTLHETLGIDSLEALRAAAEFSGDVLVGGAIAMVEPLVNSVVYHFHERAWARRGRDVTATGPQLVA